MSGLITAGVFACVLSGGAAATTEAPGSQSSPQSSTQSQPLPSGAVVAVGAPDSAFDAFLNRLMRAESNGRSHAKNPRSSALGPFQFIDSTWLAVMRKHFPDEIENKSRGQILALRTDREVARRAAKAFSRDNLNYLLDKGLKPTFGHLRLAFLLGAGGAAEVLQAPPTRSVGSILGNNVVRANPFMRRMSAADLVARATRDVSPKESVEARRQPAPADDTPARAAQPDETTRVADAEPDRPAQPEQPARVADAEPDRPAQQERSAPAAEAAPRPAASAKRTENPSGAVAVINVTCNDKHASCRRWINEQVARVLRNQTQTATDDTQSGV